MEPLTMFNTYGHFYTKPGTKILTHRDVQAGATSTVGYAMMVMMGDHYRVFIGDKCVSPNTAVGTRGSLGTAGGNTVRNFFHMSDLLRHR